MTTTEIFDEMLNRIVALSVDLERERTLRITAEHKSSETRADSAEVANLMTHMMNDTLIEAIRSYRNLTGATLKDSKDIVERVMKRGVHVK